tara:strand:+ start:265 stop:420 length:156 start_codon:yes stop_codon:yes gene_type:complete
MAMRPDIPPLPSPDVSRGLQAMVHRDAIVIAETDFPASTHGSRAASGKLDR